MTESVLKAWPPKYEPSYLPTVDSPYWDERLDTMDPEEREQRVIDKRDLYDEGIRR